MCKNPVAGEYVDRVGQHYDLQTRVNSEPAWPRCGCLGICLDQLDLQCSELVWLMPLFIIKFVHKYTTLYMCVCVKINKKDGYRQLNVHQLGSLRPWDHRGKCYMGRKRIQCLSNASQHVHTYLQPFTSYSEILVRNHNFFLPHCI